MPDYTYIYILTSGTGPIKIGYSVTPKQRQWAMRAVMDRQVRLCVTYKIPHRLGREIEKVCHAKFSKKHLGHEWFTADPIEVMAYIRSVLGWYDVPVMEVFPSVNRSSAALFFEKDTWV